MIRAALVALFLFLAWASPSLASLALDGTPTGHGAKTVTVATTVTFPTAGDILVAIVHSEGQAAYFPVTGIASTSGLTWARYTQQQATQASSFGTSPNFNTTEIWWAYSSASHTSEVVTATLSAKPDETTIIVLSVKGFTGGTYSTAPWDSNVSLPAVAHIDTNTTQAPTISSVPSTSTDGLRIDIVANGASVSYTGKPTADTAGISASEQSGNSGSDQTFSYLVYSSALSGAVTWSTTIAGPYMAISAVLATAGGGGGGGGGSGFPPTSLTTVGVGAP